MSARVARSFPPARQHPPSAVPTDEVPPGLVVLLLAPAAGPAHQHRVVLQPPQPAGLDEVGHAIPQVGGDHHLAKALHLLRFHQATDGLAAEEGGSETASARGRAPATGTASASPGSGTEVQGVGHRVWGEGCGSPRAAQVSVPHGKLVALCREG